MRDIFEYAGRHIAYLKYVLRHKKHVFEACRLPLLNVPLWVAIWHDWDKFLPTEWFGYARCFYVADGTKQYDENVGFMYAWMRHQHVNKHHWQWWLSFGAGTPIQKTNIVVMDSGAAKMFIWSDNKQYKGVGIFDCRPDLQIVARRMSDLAIREMIADWIGAGKATGSTLTTPQWYDANKHKMIIHPDSRRILEGLLDHLR